jgi:nucleotide-binding universal stress UspA family protein
MFSRILVPLDGSERAARALPVAAKLARASGGTLVLAQVLSAPAEFLPYVAAGLEPATLGADLEGATNYLASLMTLPETQGISHEVEVHAGRAPSKLIDLAGSKQVDLIVLTSHGHSGLTHWALGSVAQKIARHAEVPVLLLREGGSLPGTAPAVSERPVRALVALDGSSAAEEALGPALELAVALAAPAAAALHLVRIARPDEDLEPARAYLRSMVEQMKTAQPDELRLGVSWSVAADLDVARALTRAAETGESAEGATAPAACDLIAITTYGAGGRQTWSLGSVAERLLNSLKLPLLVVRPAEQTANVAPDQQG